MCVYMNCQQICKISPKKTWPKWKSVNCLNELESSDVCDSRLCFWRACLVVQPFSTRDLVLEAALSGRSLGCLSPSARDRKWSPKRHCHSECFLSSRARNQQEGPRRRRHQRRLARRPKNTTQCVAMMAKHRLPSYARCRYWLIWQRSLLPTHYSLRNNEH